MNTEYTKGLSTGIFAFAFWGFVPLFWKQIKAIPPYEIMSFRVVCALMVLLILLALKSELKESLQLIKEKTSLVLFSTILIGSNWLIYVWAVNSGYIVETSLGYFINPLMNVFLGVFFLGERLRKIQWAAIALAAIGVSWMFVQSVGKPWIALAVAGTFALYGLTKKKLGAKSLVGLGAENILLLPVALTYLAWLFGNSKLLWPSQTPKVMTLTLLSGLATVLPLSAFGHAVKHLTLTTLGLVQYLAPTFQLTIGVLVYKEAFTSTHAASFALIWTALLLYTSEGLYNRKQVNLLKRKVV
jgi:chloramphenicol-sensitive protein RarD